jgi:hypothetical protein
MDQKPDRDSTAKRFDWDTVEEFEEPSHFQDAGPALAVVGAVAVIVGVVLPWSDAAGRQSSWGGGLAGDIWGPLAVAFAICLLLVLRAGSAFIPSDIRWLQWAPAALGVLTVLVAFDAQGSAPSVVNAYQAIGSTGSPVSGSIVTLIGAIVCAVGGIAASVKALHPDAESEGDEQDWDSDDDELVDVTVSLAEERQAQNKGQLESQTSTRIPNDDKRLHRLEFPLELVVGAVVTIVCGCVGAIAVLDIPWTAAMSPMPIILGSLLGALFGAVMTDKLWRRFVSRR